MGFQIMISEKRGKYDKFQAPRLQAIRVALNVSSVTYFTHFLTIYHLINHSRRLDLDYTVHILNGGTDQMAVHTIIIISN